MNKNLLLTKVNEYIFDDKELNLSIKNAQKIGSLLWFNNVGIYGLADIESELCDLCYNSKKWHETIGCSPNELFVVSEPYLTGGHTRLMERLSQYCENKPDLLITRMPHNTDVVARMETFFNKITGIYVSKNNYLMHVYRLVEKIQHYNKVVLNIHPDDISAVISCGIAKKNNPKLKVFFVNHADHTFSFGQTIADLWFELSEFGRRIDVLRNLKTEKSFLGIPLDIAIIDNEKHLQTSGISNGDLLVTAAAGFKYKPIRNETITKIIHPILDKYSKSKIYVIGVSKYRDYWWWATKLKYRSRIVLHSTLSYEEYLSLTNSAKGYIDSHPLPGGSAFAEQFFKGKFCIGLHSPVQGYTPIEVFKMRKFTGFHKCDNREFRRVLDMAIEVHSSDKVKERFLLALDGTICKKNLCQSFIKWSGDEHFLENKHIANIPNHLTLFDAPYGILLRFSTSWAMVKFITAKIVNQVKFLVGH
ncbi:hypothetical protein PCE38_001071 [Citrobacter freundii]|nr:hypothetical protein [Citrobacter freundii]